MSTNNKLPKDLGYKMPAEWAPHSGTLLSWPSNRETWPGERLQRVEKVYTEILRELSSCEPVHLITANETADATARRVIEKHLPENAPVIIRRIPGNDVWARDFGPIMVSRKKNGKTEYAVTNWGYNAWGGKYPPYDDDDRVPAYISETFGLTRFDPPMILEGGSIETNGNGVMLTTESVLLNPNRNPHLSKDEIEEHLKNYLGQEKIIWLESGLAGDDTDGHIDDLSRFVNERTIITMTTDDPEDVNYHVLQENLARLKAAKDQHGRSFEVVELPMPVTYVEETTVDGSEYVPASYANFYIANGGVLLPVYDPKHDDAVISAFRRYFPDRRIIPIKSTDLVWGQGSIHCITQQLYGT